MDKRTSWNGNSKKIKIPKYMYILILVVSNVNGIYFISQKELLLTLETSEELNSNEMLDHFSSLFPLPLPGWMVHQRGSNR